MGSGRAVGIDVDQGVSEALVTKPSTGVDDESRGDATPPVGRQRSQFVDRGRSAFGGVVGGVSLGEQERDDLVRRAVDREA